MTHEQLKRAGKLHSAIKDLSEFEQDRWLKSFARMTFNSEDDFNEWMSEEFPGLEEKKDKLMDDEVSPLVADYLKHRK